MLIRETQDVIVNFSPTGMIPTKEMTPHVPLSPDEIIKDVLKACELGISMVHLHVRDKDGFPSLDPAIYAEVIAGIRRAEPLLVICVSLSGRFCNDPEKRCAVLDLSSQLKPDMGSLTLSSLNFNKMASVNEPNTILFLAKKMREKGIKAELEAFDTGMLNYIKYLQKKNLLSDRQYVNLIVGNIASAQPNLLHVGTMINDLPQDALWSLGGIGDCQASMHAVAIAMNGGVRVGLEDSIYLDSERTQLATNMDLLERVYDLMKVCNRRVMSPEKLRLKLGLAKGNGEYGVDSY